MNALTLIERSEVLMHELKELRSDMEMVDDPDELVILEPLADAVEDAGNTLECWEL